MNFSCLERKKMRSFYGDFFGVFEQNVIGSGKMLFLKTRARFKWMSTHQIHRKSLQKIPLHINIRDQHWNETNRNAKQSVDNCVLHACIVWKGDRSSTGSLEKLAAVAIADIRIGKLFYCFESFTVIVLIMRETRETKKKSEHANTGAWVMHVAHSPYRSTRVQKKYNLMIAKVYLSRSNGQCIPYSTFSRIP